jgi:acyl carrier protein
VADVSETDVLAEIRRVLGEEVGHTGPIEPQHDLLRDLALDSIALITLVTGLENRFRVILTEEDAANVRTVSQLADLVARRAAGGEAAP